MHFLQEFTVLVMEQIKMIVVLGELGGRDEYSLVEALQQRRVQKPVVAWVSGTCARLFKSEVQFGHAVRTFLPFALFLAGQLLGTMFASMCIGLFKCMWHSCYWYKLLRNEKAMQITLLVSFSATQPFFVRIQFKVVIGIWGMPQGAKSGGDMESAQAKNKALENAGAIVPTSFEGLEDIIKATYEKLVILGSHLFLFTARAMFTRFTGVYMLRVSLHNRSCTFGWKFLIHFFLLMLAGREESHSSC